jgi:hypothetical protein
MNLDSKSLPKELRRSFARFQQEYFLLNRKNTILKGALFAP